MHREIRSGVTMVLMTLSALGGTTIAAETIDSASGALRAFAAGRYTQAAPALARCAEADDARCQLALGQLLVSGNGMLRDEQRAFHWTRAAAVQGLSAAQLQLGVMYAHGDGVTMDYEQAIEWVQRAAHQDNAKARRILHFMLTEARGEDC